MNAPFRSNVDLALCLECNDFLVAIGFAPACPGCDRELLRRRREARLAAADSGEALTNPGPAPAEPLGSRPAVLPKVPAPAMAARAAVKRARTPVANTGRVA